LQTGKPQQVVLSSENEVVAKVLRNILRLLGMCMLRENQRKEADIMMTLAELLSPTQAASLLGVSVRTLDEWRVTPRRQKRLKYVKLGGKICYRQSDVLAFIDANVRDPGADPPRPKRANGIKRRGAG
jgi:excisionase family DNA binding protein